jgi:TonB-linked SusC/RagA family outer membrane protein
MKKRIHFREKIRFIMKISFLQTIIISLFMSMSYASEVTGQEILERKISLDLQKGSLRQALLKIEKIADVKFLFYSQLVPVNERISIVAKNERLADVLDKILTTRKIKFEADGNQIILTKANVNKSESSRLLPTENGQNTILLTGRILDQTGQPIPGVNILVKGTTTGTTSDADGKYTLSVPDENTVLVISFIGFIPQEILVGNRIEINVSLANDITTLNEVMVVGYGTQKKSEVISSISSIEAKDLKLQAMANFEGGLQGLAAGVSVQSQSGAPGSPVRILIRGANSITLSTDPLYIIDGMPISMGPGGVGSSNLSPMALINQNDIESVQILKDAAATSIYGSRGSNGVIIVTTKSGKKGEGSSSFNYATGFSTLTRTPDDVGYANTQDYFNIMDEAYARSFPAGNRPFRMGDYYNKTPNTTSPNITREQAEGINTNWYNELFDLGTFQSYNLSGMKGTDKTLFFVSGNYRKDKGVQKNNTLERFTVRSNLDFNPSKNVTISSKLTVGYTKNDQRQSGITSISVNALPWLPLRELDDPNTYYNAYTGANPVALSDPKNVLNQIEQYRALGGVSLNYNMDYVPGLSVRTEFSGDFLQSDITNWNSASIRLDGSQQPQSAARQENVTYRSVNYNVYFNYNKTFGDHTITATLGAEATRSYQDYLSASGTGLNGIYPQLGSPTNQTGILGRKQGERYLLGYFGRANYSYKGRYMFGLSARRDGSSVFVEQNRWGNFVAASAGWILSEESFMSFLGGDTFLKIRGSYGETGNQNIPSFLDYVNYNTNPVIYGSQTIQGVNGTVPINVGVNNLQWEATRSSDVGVDFGFFRNRLDGSVAYYHRLISQQLFQAPIAPSTGLSSPTSILDGGAYDNSSNTIWGNFGNMVNSGFELELHSINVDNNGFKWTTDFNIGFNKNVIQSLDPSIDKNGGGLKNAYGNAISRTGDRRYVWLIADYAGVDPVTGVPMIYELDKDNYAATGETQRVKGGDGKDKLLPANVSNMQANIFLQNGKSGDPKYQGGITNTFQYQGFDLNFMIVFSGGNYILDYDRQVASIVNPAHAILKEVYEQSWRNPGDIAKYPQMRADFTYVVNGEKVAGFSGQGAYHNGFLYRGDFSRLRNVQFGYTLSPAIADRIKMQSVRFHVSGSNLFTITKYPGFDPEGVGTSQAAGFVFFANAIPQLKTITFGVDLRF